MTKRFPVLHGRGFCKSIPWMLIEPHRAQAMKNHGGQSLEDLARRGGLSAEELVAVLTDNDFTAIYVESTIP